jgi:GNAT superfamily N-acetyltransferase
MGSTEEAIPMTTIKPTTRTEATQKVPLGPNRWATIRPIESGDRDRLFDFYRRLTPRSRWLRFLSASAGIGRGAASTFACVDHRHRDGFVAILAEAGPDDGTIIGHLCLEPDPAGIDVEELAVAVADEFQGRGIGSALVGAAMASARRRGVRRLTATLLPTNGQMLGLLRETRLPIARDEFDAGVEEVALVLAA